MFCLKLVKTAVITNFMCQIGYAMVQVVWLSTSLVVAMKISFRCD